MKHIFLALIILITFDAVNGQTTVIGLDQVGSEDIVQITYDSHDSWVEWSNDDKSIFFISSVSGRNNLYKIDLYEIQLTEIDSNFFAATYLIDSLTVSPIKQLTYEDELTVESPVVVPNTQSIAFRTYTCDPSPCHDFSIRILNLINNETTIVLEEENSIQLFGFLDENRLLYVTRNSDSTINELDLTTGEKSTFATFDFSINIMNIDEGIILVGSETDVYSVDATSKDKELIYSGRLFGSRISRIGDYLIGTLPGPASGLINIKTKEQTAFVNSYDYHPSLSNSNSTVAIISEGATGILIKKLDL